MSSARPLAMMLVVGLAALGCRPAEEPSAGKSDDTVGSSTRTTAVHPSHGERHAMWVTATAYCSRPQETDGDPFIAAWGDRLDPDVKSIAVSRNLLDLGLQRGTKVWIEVDGREEGPWLVLDKMARRWTDRIDLYYGTDVKAALEWGKRRVRIHWTTD